MRKSWSSRAPSSRVSSWRADATSSAITSNACLAARAGTSSRVNQPRHPSVFMRPNNSPWFLALPFGAPSWLSNPRSGIWFHPRYQAFKLPQLSVIFLIAVRLISALIKSPRTRAFLGLRSIGGRGISRPSAKPRMPAKMAITPHQCRPESLGASSICSGRPTGSQYSG